MIAATSMPVHADMIRRKQDIFVLTIRYGLILIFEEIFECAGQNSMEVMAELSDKILTV